MPFVLATVTDFASTVGLDEQISGPNANRGNGGIESRQNDAARAGVRKGGRTTNSGI